MILPASYSNGFAPRDGSPLYPELWRGCVGAWNPGLGPTGLTLIDWSGYRNDGTLTNMDAAGDWVASGGRYALDFDATNDSVTLPSKQYLFAGQAFTLSWFEQITANAAIYPARFRLQSATNTYGVFRTTDANYSHLSWGQWSMTTGKKASVSTVADSVGIWKHFAIVAKAGPTSETVSDFACYENGIAVTVSNSGSYGIFLETPSVIGYHSALSAANCKLDSMMLHSRVLSASEIRTLASRRGVAYELAPRRRSSGSVTAGGGFKAAWIPRRSLVIGGGTN
jgi:hypothetical protein